MSSLDTPFCTGIHWVLRIYINWVYGWMDWYEGKPTQCTGMLRPFTVISSASVAGAVAFNPKQMRKSAVIIGPKRVQQKSNKIRWISRMNAKRLHAPVHDWLKTNRKVTNHDMTVYCSPRCGKICSSTKLLTNSVDICLAVSFGLGGVNYHVVGKFSAP